MLTLLSFKSNVIYTEILSGQEMNRNIIHNQIRKHRLLHEPPKAYFVCGTVCFTFHKIYFGCSQIDGDYIWNPSHKSVT